LFKTRNSKFWLQDHSKFQTDFVALSPHGAQYLVDHGIKTVGIDYLSIAPYKSSRPTHEILLKAGVFILEGVDLSEVSQGNYTLYCLPLNLQGVDGAPARAVLVQA
jgi:arylformamidase